jgi:MerR family Zn(II)-responsive transcriptional regulator of zntA
MVYLSSPSLLYPPLSHYNETRAGALLCDTPTMSPAIRELRSMVLLYHLAHNAIWSHSPQHIYFQNQGGFAAIHDLNTSDYLLLKSIVGSNLNNTFGTGNYTVYFIVHIFFLMRLINQLSKETGIPIGTIRFYEKSGLINGEKKPEVKTNNYVYYGDDVIDKLRFIQMAKAVGFTLNEIKEVVDAWYLKKISKKAQLEVLNKKLLQIDEKIQELNEMKKQIAVCKENIERR